MDRVLAEPMFEDAEVVDESPAPDAAEVPATSGLGALLVLLTPFGLAAWVGIGLAIYRLVA
jgi:hypothetical protein